MAVLRAAFVAAVCFSWAPAALAQTPVPATREDLIARQQEEKARNAAPYEPGRAEALFLRFEERGFPLVGSPPGFYPALDSVYPGGGLALGAGYRKFTGHRALIDVRGLYSIATYKRVEAAFRSPGHVRDRVGIGARAGWLDAPRVAFFGIGARTDRIDRTVFRIRQTYLEGDVDWRPASWVQFGVAGGYEAYDQGPGTGSGPSIEERFTPDEAPGLGEDWRFSKVSTSAALLWTDTPAYSRNGGFLRWTYDARVRLDADGSFGLTRTEIVQHIPILHPARNLGRLAPRSRRRRCRRGRRPVFPDAVAWQWRYAARLSDRPIPRPPQSAAVWRVALDSEPARTRPRVVRRRRQRRRHVE